MARGALRWPVKVGPLIGKFPEPGLPIQLGGHPLPDERSVAATERLLQFLVQRTADEEVIFLLSGGASALMGAPLSPLTLPMIRQATEQLLRSGASIQEINTVRRHWGQALGGQLALATSARLRVLALSDVVGDDPATIGSGPASPDPTTVADAVAVAAHRGIAIDEFAETPKPGDPRLARASVEIIATPASLREAAAKAAAVLGLAVFAESTLVTGDIDALAQKYFDLAHSLPAHTIYIAVGEPTVRVRGSGKGGRSQQLALTVARQIAGLNCAFAAVGSDGNDGPTDAAGAIIDGSTWNSAWTLGPDRALGDCDSYPLLDAIGALVRLGPTGTNLLDLHLLMTSP